MTTVNIHEAKTNFSKLIDRVLREGEEIIIAKAGRPAAKLVPMSAPKKIRKPGALKGKIKIAKDFDAPLPEEVLNQFTGKE